MPDLSNIPGFTALATAGDLPNFPVQADSWNAPEDATSKKTSNPTFTVSGVTFQCNAGSYEGRHVWRGQGGVKGNNKIMTHAWFWTQDQVSGLSNKYQSSAQVHVWEINTSTGALTVTTTNKELVTGSSSPFTSQYIPDGAFFDASGSGYLMGGFEGGFDSSSGGDVTATYMRQIDSSFSNIGLALDYDSTVSGGGLHANSGRDYGRWGSYQVPLTSTDSAGGSSFMAQGFMGSGGGDGLEIAYPNGAEVSFDHYSGIWQSNYARYAYGNTTYVQPDAPVCGTNDFHSIIGGYGTSSSTSKCIQFSGGRSYYDTGNMSGNNARYTGQDSWAYQRSGSTHTIYLSANNGERANETLPMTSYNTSVLSVTAKSWSLPRWGKGKIGQSCAGIGNNEWVSCLKEDSHVIAFHNDKQDTWPIIKWELDDTNGVTIKGAVNGPKLGFLKGSPLITDNIDTTANSEMQWFFPIWTNANDADPSWVVVVWFYPTSWGGDGPFSQPIVKSYPWPTFKSLSVALG